ncbi:hypothetical protein L873DRAFT_1842814 [Choiromyces venosus 120613-1]|uniref:Uncharacterized protein n=1 Tax=Choiromyces venosus 120613-1 TaxID=1336337 RepID=A0A3N4JUZ3_9PEZI|nr:hypothetical protein L873DRAFT_1842814 [Choiromyces venosus 120613-1]
MFNMDIMEFFTAGINPPPSTPLLQSPIIEPQRAITPTISVLDIDDNSGKVHHHHFGVVSRDKIAVITYVAKKRDEFPPAPEISTSWSVPRKALATYVLFLKFANFALDDKDLVNTATQLGLPKNSKFTILLSNGLQVHPSFWAAHVNAEDIIYIRFSPERPVFFMPPPAYTPIPQHSIKVSIDGLWAEGSEANPQRLLIVCKSGTHLTAAEIHSGVLDAANRIVTQCRYAVEPKGQSLAGFEMFVPGIGLVDEKMELDMVAMAEEGTEVQCTAIWR